MAIIKCKMCGGDIEISPDKTFGTCEYCGSTMTLPKVDDEQRAAAFNRGNHFRRSGEFDKALAVYERIVAEDDNDAEAHWCCALCRFGIEYVEDPATYEWLPTCHRASFDSFLEDVDYLAAVEHSDGITRRQYQKDAAKIAEVQRGILATSQNEQPFDVFLCYKETGEDGQRTRDSLMAQEVYYELTEQGYRVFFARITLEDKAGAEYEPYIFAALNSAKVMVVIGSKPEHFNAVWVKNEWSRFLSMMKKDRSKLLLPCYRDMDPYDLPEALSVLQSYDMSKIGFMQDLIRGVKKVIDAGKPQETAKETVKETVVVHNEGGSNVQALLKRGNMALEDGEWSKADEFFEQVLNQNAECAEAYLGKFLSSKKERTTQDYAQCYCEKAANSAPTKKKTLACEEDQAFIDTCIKKYQVAGYYTPEAIRKALAYDRFYCADRAAYFREGQEKIKSTLDADRNFARAEKFASGELKAQCGALRSGIMNFLRQQEQKAEQEAAAEQQRITGAYHAFLKETELKLAARQQEALAKKKKDEEAAAKKKETLEKEKQAAVAAIAQRKAKIQREEATLQQEEATLQQELLRIRGLFTGKRRKEITARLEEIAAGMQKLAAELQKLELMNYAEAFYAQGELKKAAIFFGKVGNYQDARKRSFALWNDIAKRDSIGAGDYYTIGLKADGTVIATGENDDGQCDVFDWTDIVAISAGYYHTVGLKADGTVVAVGDDQDGQCVVSDWADIVAISAGGNHTVGLKADGTIVAVGYNKDGQCDVSVWTDIVAISAGGWHTVGLKADGIVVAVGSNKDGQCDVSDWADIVSISVGASHTVGLKADGTVVAVGHNRYGQCNVSSWSNIVTVACGDYHTVGVKADGTVVAVGHNRYGQCNVSSWSNIVTVACGHCHTVGVKADGTVVAVGEYEDEAGDEDEYEDEYEDEHEFGQCDVTGWTDIKVPNK